MRDNIPDALVAAFERQYDADWNNPQLRNERLAMRYGWAAAMEAKQCLHQIQEPAAVAAPDEREALKKIMDACEQIPEGLEGYLEPLSNAIAEARAALAATPADHVERVLKMVPDHSEQHLDMVSAAPVVPNGWVPCVVTYEGQHPEEVAYGPQVMMDRLKKWLERYFELKAATAEDHVADGGNWEPSPAAAPTAMLEKSAITIGDLIFRAQLLLSPESKDAPETLGYIEDVSSFFYLLARNCGGISHEAIEASTEAWMEEDAKAAAKRFLKSVFSLEPAAAPVVLPEPVAEVVKCGVMGQQTVTELNGSWKALSYGTKLYTEQQVRTLLSAGRQTQEGTNDSELLDFIESHVEGVIRLDAVPNYLHWGRHWEHKTARAAIAAAKGE